MKLAEIRGEDISVPKANPYSIKRCIDFAQKVNENSIILWNTGFVDQRTRLQALLFPKGLKYNKENGTLVASQVNEFFGKTISDTFEEIPEEKDKYKSLLSHFTLGDIDCSINALKDKWTFEHINSKSGFESCSKGVYKNLICFLEDYCLLMVSSYLSETRKTLKDSQINE